MCKPTTYRATVKILTSHGFSRVATNKHEKWQNGDKQVVIPRAKNGWSMMMAKRLLKEVGIV